MTQTNGTTNERNVTELSGFTPGPWIVQSQGPMCSIYVMQDDGNKYPFVAHVQTLDLARDWQTQERIGIANAQLIAAAPQMHADLARLRAENERLRRALYAAGWWMDLPCSDACPSDDLHGLDYDGQREWVEHTISAALKGE